MAKKTFQSKYKLHKLTIEPKRPTIEAGKKGFSKGKSIVFADFRYETEDKEEIEFLEDYISNHPRIMFDMSKQKEKVENVDDMKKEIKELKEKNAQLESEKGTTSGVIGQNEEGGDNSRDIDEKFMKASIKEAITARKEGNFKKAMEILAEIPEDSKHINWAKNEIATTEKEMPKEEDSGGLL